MLFGVVVSYGHARLVPMIPVVAVGAICGDTIGYELGRRFGGVMRTSRLGRRIKQEHWARAEAYLTRRGGWAAMFGRFVSIGRVPVPSSLVRAACPIDASGFSMAVAPRCGRVRK